MDPDELVAPLGQRKPQKGRKMPVLAGVLGLFGLAVAGGVLFADNPLGGKTVAVKSTLSARQTDAGDDKHQTGHDGHNSLVPPTRAMAFQQVPPPDAKIITITDGSTGQHQDVVIPGPSPRFAPAR